MVLEYASVYEDFAIFLAHLSPKKILAYKASTSAQERVRMLIAKSKAEGLNQSENAEMECYMIVEHIVQLAKAKALQRLS